MTSRLNARLRPSSLLCGLVATMSLLVIGCSTDHVAQSGQPIASKGTGSTAGSADPGGGTNASSCSDLIADVAKLCDPPEKKYTPDEIAACKATQQHAYDECVRAEACDPVRVAQEKACGAKPSEGTPERTKFEACLTAAGAAWVTCMGDLLDDQP